MTARPTYNPPHAIYSARQRTVVLTFPTVEAADAFDQLDDDEVLLAVRAARPSIVRVR